PADEQFFTQLQSVARTAAEAVADPSAYRNPWGRLMSAPPAQQDLLAEPQYFFSGDGSLAFLLCRPVKAADSFTPARGAGDEMRRLIAATGDEHPGLKFGLTGLPVLETDEMAASQDDTNTASWLALVGVALLYLVAYRNLRYPLLTVLALAAGTA